MNLSQHNHDPSIEPSVPGLSMMRISIGLFGAPAAWIAQVFLSEPLAAHACYPYQTPLSAPIWGGLSAILVTISAACLAAALLSGFIAWNSCRQLKSRQAGKGGSAENRTRFLANLSIMSSFIFTVAIIFNICVIFLVPPCSSWF